MFDTLKEECGIFGVFNHPKAAELTYYGLRALQHRGQEGCGIVVSDTKEHRILKGQGLVTDVFVQQEMHKLIGDRAIGHVRYSTTGSNCNENVQPFLFKHHTGDFSLCHNGNLVNSEILKRELEKQGSLFQSTSDSEIIAHLVKKNQKEDRFEVIKDALLKLEGAFSFLLMTKHTMYAMRDKNGIRPLSLGKLNNNSFVLSSETCALDLVGAEYVRDILPGEILRIDAEGKIESQFYVSETKSKICSMEYIYFSRPDSNINDINVHSFRKYTGKILAKTKPVEADIVIGVPDSSISAAIGYSEESGIPYEMGLIKNKYAGRTFIEPSKELRNQAIKIKLAAVISIVKNKRVVVIDDSIVRGTTSQRIVNLLRNAGATEVHFRVASPPFVNPCFYGVDTSTYQELIANKKTQEELKEYIGADSLAFLSNSELLNAVKTLKKDLDIDICQACFDGKYPTPLFEKLEEANQIIKL